jgi:hypothetical protein
MAIQLPFVEACEEVSELVVGPVAMVLKFKGT